EHAVVVDKPSGADAQPPVVHSDQNAYRSRNWEKLTVAALVVVIILAVLYAALQKDEIPARNFTLLRILLSAAMGFMGGVIPGFLRVDLSWRGVLIRSSGGLALGVLSFFFPPALVPNDPPKPGPDNSRRPSSLGWYSGLAPAIYHSKPEFSGIPSEIDDVQQMPAYLSNTDFQEV